MTNAAKNWNIKDLRAVWLYLCSVAEMYKVLKMDPINMLQKQRRHTKKQNCHKGG